MKIQEKNGQYFLTIPKAIMTLKKWKRHDNLEFVLDKKGNINIVDE